MTESEIAHKVAKYMNKAPFLSWNVCMQIGFKFQKEPDEIMNRTIQRALEFYKTTDAGCKE